MLSDSREVTATGIDMILECFRVALEATFEKFEKLTRGISRRIGF